MLLLKRPRLERVKAALAFQRCKSLVQALRDPGKGQRVKAFGAIWD